MLLFSLTMDLFNDNNNIIIVKIFNMIKLTNTRGHIIDYSQCGTQFSAWLFITTVTYIIMFYYANRQT